MLFRKYPDDGQSPKTQYLCVFMDVAWQQARRGDARRYSSRHVENTASSTGVLSLRFLVGLNTPQ
jgi:hypothetical protein